MPESIEYDCADCGSTFTRTGSDQCFLCGAPGTPRPTQAARPAADKSPAQPINPLALYSAGRRVFKGGKWVLGGVLTLILGGGLLFDSRLHDDPGRIGARDIALGVAVIVVGLITIGFGTWIIRTVKPIRIPAPSQQ